MQRGGRAERLACAQALRVDVRELRAPAVELVPVVEVQSNAQCLLRGFGPLEDLFGPVHTEETMHLAVLDHLELCCVPELVMSLTLVQLRLGVNIFTGVLGVLGERVLGQG